jgi:hypothetical protein
LSDLNQKRLKALYAALNAMSAENRLILAEKYYTKNHQSNSDYKMAALKNMPVSHYRAMLYEAQKEFCQYFHPLDKKIVDAEFEERLQKEQQRNQKYLDYISKRWPTT